MSRKKMKRATRDYQDMAARAKRASRSRAKISVIQEAAGALEPEYEEDFYDIWHDWMAEYDDR